MRIGSLVCTALIMFTGTSVADENGQITKSYPVADLVVPFATPPVKTTPFGTFRPVDTPTDCPTPPPDFRKNVDALTGVVAQTICPPSWQSAGGKGTISFNTKQLAVVIRNTPDVHAAVAELLETLRKLQDKSTPQVVMEFRIIDMASECYTRFQDGKEEKKHEFLSDVQVQKFLEFVQGDRRANVLSAPKVTTFSGRQAIIQIGEQIVLPPVPAAGLQAILPKSAPEVAELGFRLTVTPEVSADRKLVTMEIGHETANCTRIGIDENEHRAEIERSECTFAWMVPVGKTLMISGPERMQEVRTEFGAPILSKIPYVNRLFKNVGVGRELRRQVILVTCRVIESE